MQPVTKTGEDRRILSDRLHPERTTTMPAHAPIPPVRQRRAAQPHDLLPLGDWYRHHSLRSWPVLLFLLLICVPAIALVILGTTPSQSTFEHVAWIFAAYFAVAWLLLLGVIIRPEHVTRTMLVTVTVIALVTQTPLAIALEGALHGSNSGLGHSIFSIGIPEELAKALPVLAVALIYRGRHHLEPRDYLFVGAVSGLVFGASEVVRYFTVNGVVQFYQTVQAAIPSIEHLLRSGHSASTSLFAALIGPVLYFILDFVWRFVTDPISHACWSGLSGYFIGLAATGRYRWYQVAWIGVAAAAVLHGLNDWSRVNGHPVWILVVVVSGILFLGYAKVGSRDTRLADVQAPPFLQPHLPPAGDAPDDAAAGGPPDGHEPRPADRQPAGTSSRHGRHRPWWEH
jgi:RsiW-degrading membrane proteinase PrsW (M82 family)